MDISSQLTMAYNAPNARFSSGYNIELILILLTGIYMWTNVYIVYICEHDLLGWSRFQNMLAMKIIIPMNGPGQGSVHRRGSRTTSHEWRIPRDIECQDCQETPYQHMTRGLMFQDLVSL